MDKLNPAPNPALPWWRVPVMWLLLGGPALVVAACLATGFVAVRGADMPLRALPTAAVTGPQSQTPATQARNHVVTPQR